MYIDLILLIAILAIVVIIFRRWSNFVYAVVIIDIFLRILSFIEKNVSIPDLQNIIFKYFPVNIPSLVSRYITGIFYDSFMWLFVIIYGFFLFYTFCIFIKKSK